MATTDAEPATWDLQSLQQLLDYPNRAFEDMAWHRALAKGDAQGAKAVLIYELRTGPPRSDIEQSMVEINRRWIGLNFGYQGGHWLDPDQVIRQHYVGVYGIEHTFEDEIDWLYDPTAQWGADRTPEWQVQLNRHYQWITLADRYRETGDARYARAFEKELRSWVRQCPRPRDNGMGLPGCWRLIEVGIRAGSIWPYAFEVFRHSKHVSDEAIWQMVAALHEHGMHLLLWPTKRNFKTMESNGLTHVGAMFPEFRLSRTFLTTGLDRCCAELERQVYPQGIQDELAPSYGVLSLANFYCAAEVARSHQTFGAEIPQRMDERLERMVEALGRIADPDGRMPPIHDSPARSLEGLYADFRKREGGQRLAERPWSKTGVDHLPWAGWVVLRREGRYSLFDAGPWGTGHQHADALQLLLYAHGKWLCIDPGKPLYNTSARTRYMRGAPGHNVVLADGRRHHAEPRIPVTRQAFPMAVHDAGWVYATAAVRHNRVLHEDGPQSYGCFEHERVVLDVAGLGWVVYDRVQYDDDRPHAWEWLWHLNPELTPRVDESAAVHAVCDSGPGLLIQPAGVEGLTTSVTRGQDEPFVRGWHRRDDEREHPEPCPTVGMAVGARPGRVGLFTILAPCETGEIPPLRVCEALPDRGKLSIQIDGRSYAFRFDGRESVNHIEVEREGTAASIDLAPHSLGVAG